MSKKAIEFIRKARKGLESEIVCPRKYGICKHDNENCPIYNLDQALAELKAKPPAGKFTKRFRELITLSEEHLSDNKIGRLRTYGKEACVIIDQQAEEIERLKALCYRESQVLKEALKRKNNKSMICVVADSLAEQALKGE